MNDQPITITTDTVTALQRANCLAAAVLLNEKAFDETPKQKFQRARLIAEIVATQEVAAKTADPRVVEIVWKRLWAKVQRELLIRGVKL